MKWLIVHATQHYINRDFLYIFYCFPCPFFFFFNSFHLLKNMVLRLGDTAPGKEREQGGSYSILTTMYINRL